MVLSTVILYTWDGGQVSTEEMWDRFVAHYAKKHGFVDKATNKLTMKNFLGSIEGYKREFLAAQEEA